MVGPATFRRAYKCRINTTLLARNASRNLTTTIIRQPSPLAPREAPTPLVFATAKGWYEKESSFGLKTLASSFPELGFTTLEVNIDPEIKDASSLKSIEDVLRLYAKELRSQIVLYNSFPPVLIARGINALIAQTFVESFSTSALVLIGGETLVPSQIQPSESLRHMLKSSTFARPDFTYEPRFPILSIEAVGTHSAKNGSYTDLMASRGEDVDIMEDEGLLDKVKIYHSIRSWIDRVGI